METITAKKIIIDLKSGDIPFLRKNLLEMTFVYLVKEDDEESRDEMYGTFLNLDRALQAIEAMPEEKK